MLRARLLICALVALVLGAASGTARSDGGVPTNLHAFMLRADETPATTFSRTPSFAWNPVSGATKYQFQLSLASSFRDNAVVYANNDVPSPVIAPHLTLPWISGDPHSLYARVRAVTSAGAGDWSSPFGFDMAPPAPPTPLPSYPGVLRWTPIEGVDSYEVWLVDVGKMIVVNTNVLDEREFYTFHQTQGWMGSIRWRIRVLRPDISEANNNRLNSIPAAFYGAWSKTFVSTNPAFGGGPIKLLGTVSDIYSNGGTTAPAHRLMPAFLFTGNQSLTGAPAELFRVEVFTDKQCLNRVFTGAVTGSPAYAPRPYGPLGLPTTAQGLVAARGSYLADGSEPPGVTADGDTLKTTESDEAATATGSSPGEPGDTDGTSGTTGGSSSGGSGGSSGGATVGSLTVSGDLGAPVDLWDTDWPASGYYWTVIAVSASTPDAFSTSVAAPGSAVDDTVLPLTNPSGLFPGDIVTVGAGPTAETVVIASVNANGTVTIGQKLRFGHGAGEAVVRTSGNLLYRDLELPQDVCAAGRVSRFGKESEPSLAASGDIFATGLSSVGTLVGADDTTKFYGQPLVAWTPALGASAYEIQWSKTRKPFVAEVAPGGKRGWVTASTSVVLPVGTGSWYYRVRGIDFQLPSKAQQMSWSDVQQIVVAPPSFKIDTSSKGTYTIVGGDKTTKTASAMKAAKGSGFSIQVPTAWKAWGGTSFLYHDGPNRTWVSVSLDKGRGSKTMQQWASDVSAHYVPKRTGVKVVTVPAGQAVQDSLVGTSAANRPTRQLEYRIDASSTAKSYVITFTSDASTFAKNRVLFAKMIATFKLGR